MKSSSNQFNCNSITRSGQSDAICQPPSHPPTTTTSRSYNSNDAALPTTHNHPIRSIHNHQHPFNRFQRNKIQKPNQKKEKESKKEEEVEEEEEEEEEGEGEGKKIRQIAFEFLQFSAVSEGDQHKLCISFQLGRPSAVNYNRNNRQEETRS